MSEATSLASSPHPTAYDDRVYVADRENNRVQIFSTEGDYITEWRDLYHPMDIFIDAQDRVYVTDQIPRITVFDTDGRVLDLEAARDAERAVVQGDKI